MTDKEIEIFDEVSRDGHAVSALLFYRLNDPKEIINTLTREQKILFLKYAAKEAPEYFDYYNGEEFNNNMNSISNNTLSEMVDEVDWLWK